MAVKGVSCEVVKLLLEADAAIVMLPDKLSRFHVLLIKKGISTYDYIIALREQEQGIVGQQSPQMSPVSSLTGLSSASSVNAFHRGAWCTPPWLFLEDQFDVIPLDSGSISSLGKKTVTEEPIKKKGPTAVKISPWTLARLNAEQVSKAAAEAGKKREEIVNELLRLRDTNVKVLTRDHKTAIDIAEELPLSEESSAIKDCLYRAGAVRANELNQPRDELRNTVTQIKNDVHTQLEQTMRTNKNVHGIAKKLRKLHREGINNATNSVTVVAVLFATVAFAAIFTVPGGDNDNGMAVVASSISFQIFFIFNAIALFTSLAVVVVQITLVRGETKAERRVVEVINKLMWLASVCTSVAFMASSYIVVGRKHEWAAILVTVVGGVIMAGVLGTMTYYVVKSKRSRSIRRRVARSGSTSWQHSEFSNSENDRIYAL